MRKKWWFVLCLALCLVAFTGCGNGSESAAGKAQTPEEAISSFLGALSAHRGREELLQACPAKRMAERFDASYAKEKGITSPEQLKKNADPETYLSAFSIQIPVFTGSLLSSDLQLPPGVDENDPGSYTMENVIRDTDFYVGQLKGNIRILRIDSPIKDGVKSYEANKKTQIAMYGAEDVAERVALLEYDGRTYLAGFSLVRYEGAWYLKSLTSVLGQTSSSGSLQEMTETEYDSLLKQYDSYQ